MDERGTTVLDKRCVGKNIISPARRGLRGVCTWRK